RTHCLSSCYVYVVTIPIVLVKENTMNSNRKRASLQTNALSFPTILIICLKNNMIVISFLWLVCLFVCFGILIGRINGVYYFISCDIKTVMNGFFFNRRSLSNFHNIFS